MEKKIEIAAIRLTISYADDSNIPVRFKSSSDKQKKINLESNVEVRFKENVDQWKKIIETMLQKLDNDLVWRFVNISPITDDTSKSVAYQKDFRDFVDYLSLRRDSEKCNTEELGGLAQLLGSFQRELDKKLNQTQ